MIAQYIPEALTVLAVVLALLAIWTVFAFGRALWLALVPRRQPTVYYRGAVGRKTRH